MLIAAQVSSLPGKSPIHQAVRYASFHFFSGSNEYLSYLLKFSIQHEETNPSSWIQVTDTGQVAAGALARPRLKVRVRAASSAPPLPPPSLSSAALCCLLLPLPPSPLTLSCISGPSSSPQPASRSSSRSALSSTLALTQPLA